MSEENFSIDEELDNAFNLENDNDTDLSENDDLGDENDEENEEESFNEESLDEIMEATDNKSKKKADKNDQNVDPSQQNQQQQQNKSKRSNNPEDLVDKDGNIIAKAGAERRFYEESVRLKKEKADFNQRILPTLKNNYEMMYNKCNAYEQTLKAMQMGDLSTQDINTGMELMRLWNKSPEDTIKFLLTQAKSYGINVDTGTSVDTAAIDQMLDAKLKPFIEEREAVQREQEIKTRAKNIYDNFLIKYPDAQNHQQEIAELWRRNPSLSLDAVYYQIKNHYLEKGYDFNTPLVEIINKQKQEQRENDQKMHSVGNVGVNQSIKTQNIQTPVASINKSYDYIINEAMKNAKR